MAHIASLARPVPLLALLALSGCYHVDEVVQRDAEDLLEEFASSSEALTNTEIPGGFDGYSDPELLGFDFEMRFDALPLSARLHREPWSDSYWPKNEGGISHRWQTGEQHDYRFWTRDEALSATPEQVALLSPAEKYDLFVGNYDFPLAQRVRARNQPSEPGWAGYCHGWSPASVHFAEPAPRTLSNGDGLEIPFGSSDIKALLTYFDGEVLPSTYSAEVLPFRTAAQPMGSMCSTGKLNDPACYDLNPGGLHAFLANQIGLEGGLLVIDVDPNYEKWNQPVYGYDAQVVAQRAPSPGADEEAVRELVMQTRITWGQEIQPQWEPTVGTDRNELTSKDFLYTVELDASGRIVGGQWVMHDGGAFWTLGQAWDWLRDYDRDGDSAPDLTVDERSQLANQWFNRLDFAWTIAEGEISPDFDQAASSYTLIGGGVGTRRALYGYFGKLGLLID